MSNHKAKRKRFGNCGKSRYSTVWVVIDIAGNPIRQFDDRATAEEFVEILHPGCRIQEMGITAQEGILIKNSVLGGLSK